MSQAAVIVNQYKPDQQQLWDEFVEASKIPHFMFKRNYIEYHSDRFEDSSLIFTNQKNHILGVIPANVSNNLFYTHQGLSFGGFILSREVTADLIHEMFQCLITWCRDVRHLDKIIYKRTPDIYAVQPTQEDIYFLQIMGAQKFRTDLSTTINLSDPLPMQNMRKRLIKKAIQRGVEVNKTTAEKCWPLIEDVLKTNHNTRPVHSFNEMLKLQKFFPENITCWSATTADTINSCVIVYSTGSIAHAQYIANSETGRQNGALDLLFHELITKHYDTLKYFDFGISTVQSGLQLNAGLVAQKQGFGGRGIVHEFFEIEL